MEGDVVEISQEEYDQLVDDALLLNCLRNAGVDNWDGWDFAIEAYHEQTESDNG